MKYTRIEYNITLADGTSESPVAFEVNEATEEAIWLADARNNYPNPAIIYEDCEGHSPTADQACHYDMMIVANELS